MSEHDQHHQHNKERHDESRAEKHHEEQARERAQDADSSLAPVCGSRSELLIIGAVLTLLLVDPDLDLPDLINTPRSRPPSLCPTSPEREHDRDSRKAVQFQPAGRVRGLELDLPVTRPPCGCRFRRFQGHFSSVRRWRAIGARLDGGRFDLHQSTNHIEEHRRQEDAEERHPDHAREHRRAQRPAHFRPGPV